MPGQSKAISYHLTYHPITLSPITDKDDIAFRTELENLRLPDYKLVHVLADNTGMEGADQGFISAEIIAREASAREEPTYMISGPPAMVRAITAALAKIDVPADRVHTDIFLGYD